MSENDFLEVYLREIGVGTPISLLSLQPTEVDSMPVNDAGSMVCSDLVALQKQVSQCKSCGLSESCRNIVFGAGNKQAEVVFIGEAPDLLEDEDGQPFLGEVGSLFDAMLTALELQREQVYMMNIIKCRSPHHRDPKPDELRSCLTWLDAQLDLIQPKMIVVLGRVAAQALLSSELTLRELRQGLHTYRGIDVQVIYHPAYLLRSPRQKAEAWKDLQKLKTYFTAQ
ncbi:MAG: uracil-DNA glycosylase [Mariprofundaceae bacterium]